MVIGTGITVYEQILSIDVDNNPVTGATFDVMMYKDGDLYTGITTSVYSVDNSRGIFVAEWSADTIGNYQMYAKNNSTSVIFLSNNVIVKPENEISTSVYIGL